MDGGNPTKTKNIHLYFLKLLVLLWENWVIYWTRCTAVVSRWMQRQSSHQQIKHNLNAVQWRQLPTRHSDPSAENSPDLTEGVKTLELSSVCPSLLRCAGFRHKKVFLWKQVVQMSQQVMFMSPNLNMSCLPTHTFKNEVNIHVCQQSTVNYE